MSRNSSGDGGDPTLHTAVIADVPTMWEKLTWDIAQFDDIQRSSPDLREPLGFAAINVCISASSLRDWTVAAFVRKRRGLGQTVDQQRVIDHIYAHVPQQRMCEAIANTAKHSRFNAAQWPDGIVRLDWEEESESDPPGYVLRHIHAGGAFDSIALNAFGDMQRSWWGELQNLGFAFSANPHGFEWQQRRLRDFFGER